MQSIRRILLIVAALTFILCDDHDHTKKFEIFEDQWDVCQRSKAYPKNSFQQDLLYNYLVENQYERWTFLILCPIAMLQALFLCFLFICYRELRQSPSDIFMGSLFYETVAAFHWFYESLMLSLGIRGMQNNSFECQTNAVLQILGQYGSFAYAMAFFYYLRTKVQGSFSAEKSGTWGLHIFILIFSWLIVLLFLSLDVTGKTIEGMCGVQYQQLDEYFIISLYLIFATFYIGGAGYSVYFLKKKIQTTEKRYSKASNEFLRFSILYFTVYLIISILIQSFEAIGGLSCTYLLDRYLLVFYTLANVTRAISVVVLPWIRCQDPYTKRIILKIFKRTATRNQLLQMDTQTDFEIMNQDTMSESHSASMELVMVGQNTMMDGPSPIVYPEDIPSNKTSMIKSAKTSIERKVAKDEDQNDSFVNLIQNNIRTGIMFKLICGVLIDDKSKYHEFEDFEINNVKGESTIFEDRKIFQINQDDLINQFEDLPPHSFIENLKTKKTQIKITSYAPIIFHSIITREKEKIDFASSLNLLDNINRIKQSSKNDGGKSGQFFFFSHDNRLMLKTITKQELNILLLKLQDYYMYIQGNTDTMIAKIYGIYSFEQVNENPVHIIVMKNLGRGSRACIQRIYDIKGSSYDREVVKKGSNLDLTKIVMKDLDFLKFEKQLNVSPQDAKKIIDNASADALFFRKCGLIDYSMIVFKVDWEKMRELHSDVCDMLEKNANHIYKSVTEPNIRYHLGIIDYLQQYDVQKKMEKYSKKFIRLNKDLDTSSQDPQTYSSRFQNFIRQIANEN